MQGFEPLCSAFVLFVFEQVHGRTVNVWLSQGAFNFVYVPYSKYTILLSL